MRYLLFTCLTLLIISACKKDKETTTVPDHTVKYEATLVSNNAEDTLSIRYYLPDSAKLINLVLPATTHWETPTLKLNMSGTYPYRTADIYLLAFSLTKAGGKITVTATIDDDIVRSYDMEGTDTVYQYIDFQYNEF